MTRALSAFRSPGGRNNYLGAYEDLLAHWPVGFEHRYVQTRLGVTHVLVCGDPAGPPVVLLPPAGAGAAIWVRNVGPLGLKHRLYAVDTIGEPGLGVLTRPFHRRQRRDFVEWMSDLLDGLGLERTDLIGNSFGGYLALVTASMLPSRVRKVVLISPAAGVAPMRAWSRHFIPAIAAGRLLSSQELLKAPFRWLWQGFPIDVALARLREVTAVEGRPRHWLPTVFSDDELRRIHAPVLLLIGDHEVIYRPKRVFDRVHRLLPDVETHLIANANHCAEYTAAAEVNARVMTFLAG